MAGGYIDADDFDRVVEPGVAHMPWWRPDGEIPEGSERIWYYYGIGQTK